MNKNTNKKYDLEDRLIEFAVLIIKIAENLKNSRAGNHIAGQIVRSGTSPSLNYGEAQSAESLSDFIHKFKILLKELRETRVALKIIKRIPLIDDIELVDKGITECNELISIFVKSIDTANKNTKKDKNN
ncbi:four helix bundle protein [Ignavibacterium sp.]|uniref:four helix bundle protein n=1 Tax=Ignavibacterium sp. TaxID=2651167 RepID=UPI0021FCE6E2|nr:four helix bundle protein [Ignavibacterium sp.]BDQ02468.1 MAG: four helix bundle protein [Ignavibacterium sp.]